ncbi:4-hydroxybenzoate octaprenyltransferase [Pseudoalteromonas rubra]|uniref:4-hydroxybenzoate octaprenyltransferase n=1 Tax=Pseudoalteromonas rubra TaxID=43658 RepID=A0A5S3WPS3_9GAMM|nr:4-hydroxybenzoate octaprenyltransferase [Pseudoalteromonas rubra]TMP29609.1 4-hydroxybenzoate octaprenyltransferase [Pseudoalteromonas rubra]TMP35202.1 4-hydroxybenzoate octaprenyltransferase [Pseudoalteromonas rubra]
MKLSRLRADHIEEYKQLMRVEKPIGTLLLMWPTLWSLWIASGGVPQWHMLLIFVLGTFMMRSAGCVINDFADRKVDGAVKRTAQRPLARGAVSEGEALTLFASLIGASFILVLMLNWQTILLSFGALALASIYPFMKRYTHLPQVVLGAAFSWGIPMAFMAVQETVPVIAWVLFIANLLWTVAYDTKYAMVDKDDDVVVGIKSTAILFGRWDRHVIAGLNVAFLACMAWVAAQVGMSMWFWVGFAVAGSWLAKLQWQINDRSRDKCFKAFLSNNYVGLAMFAGVVAGV